MRSNFDTLAITQQSPKAARVQRLKQARRKRTSLILEGGSPLRAALQEMLQSLSIEVAVTSDKAEFLRVLRASKPDLAFVDLRTSVDWHRVGCLFPDNDNESQSPIIACIGRAEASSALHALKNGADDYLIMPFDLSVLQSKLRTLGLCAL